MEVFDKDIKKIASLLQFPKNIAVIGHRNPDGDSIGSISALATVLRKCGHYTKIISPNDFPRFLKWIDENNDIVIHNRNTKKSEEIVKNTDLIFCLDFNAISRVGNMENVILKSKAKKIIIDHHPKVDNFADVEIINTNSSSTAELLYYLLKKLGYKELIDKDSAAYIYTGIMTDTGSFSYNSGKPETYNFVSEILEYGIDKDNIFDKVYNNFSESRMKLMGYCLDKKLKVINDYNAAYISLSQKELRQYNHERGDTEGFVNLPLSIKGVSFSSLIIEKSREIKLSFRSKGDIEVNKFAEKYFNGGGHKNAAGGSVKKLSLEDTVVKLRESIKTFFSD